LRNETAIPFLVNGDVGVEGTREDTRGGVNGSLCWWWLLVGGVGVMNELRFSTEVQNPLLYCTVVHSIRINYARLSIYYSII
jgi:hypothetical protein